MKILDKIIPGRRKKQIREKKLLEEYNKGKILQVNNEVNNKKYLLKKEENDKFNEPEGKINK
ncbi:MAG: hypothetical protein ACOC56_03485 [Atribacterota bacterium]